MRLSGYLILSLLLMAQGGCQKASDTAVLQPKIGTPTPSPQSTPTAAKQSSYPELELFDERADEEKDSAPLKYEGFHVILKTKVLRFEGTKTPTELSYAQLKRRGKVVLTFDEVEHPLGNETRFGLFPFLSPDTKQLLVQQDAWRDRRQWIVALEKKPKLLFDTRDYWLEGAEAMDLDCDGQYELVGGQKYWHFEFLNGMTFSSADSPVLTIVFAYNPKTQKYEPANPRFKSYLLETIARARDYLEKKPNNNPQSLFGDMSNLMLVTMTLALVGEKEAAWTFFDRYCPMGKLAEKAVAKSRISSAIRNNAAYKILKRRHQL